MPASVMDPEVRARLNLAKLRAVIRAHTGLDTIEERPLGALAGAVAGGDGFVLVTDGAGVGAALAWALRQQLPGRLHLFIDDATTAEAGTASAGAAGVVARRAALFAARPEVLRLVGAEVRTADAAPHLPVLAADPAALAAVEPLRAAGAEIVVEHGVVMAELAGLEVGRVVPDPHGGFRLEIGVGRYDREAGRVMEAVLSTDGLTRTVVDVVRSHRQLGAPPHLLNRLARQRWLRAQLIARPDLVGAARLAPLEPPLPRDNLVDPVPAFAAGETAAARPVVVACAVGVDLEAVPTAADGRDRFDPDAELVYATPARDRYPVIEELAAGLLLPARVVSLPGEWAD